MCEFLSALHSKFDEIPTIESSLKNLLLQTMKSFHTIGDSEETLIVGLCILIFKFDHKNEVEWQTFSIVSCQSSGCCCKWGTKRTWVSLMRTPRKRKTLIQWLSISCTKSPRGPRSKWPGRPRGSEVTNWLRKYFPDSRSWLVSKFFSWLDGWTS